MISFAGLLILLTSPTPVLQGVAIESYYLLLARAVEQDDKATFNNMYFALRYSNQQHRLFTFVLTRLEKAPASWQDTLIPRVSDFPSINANAAPALRTIAGNLNASRYTRLAAIRQLGTIHKADRDTIAFLQSCFTDQWIPMRGAACVSIWQIEQRPDRILPVLLALLNSPDANYNLVGLEAVHSIGPKIKDDLGQAVLQLMNSGDTSVRQAVYPLIPAFSPSREAAASKLAEALIVVSSDCTKLTEEFRAGQITLDMYTRSGRSRQATLNTISVTLATLGEHALPELIMLTNMKDRSDVRYVALDTMRTLKLPKGSAAAKSVIVEAKRLSEDADVSVKALAEVVLKDLTSD